MKLRLLSLIMASTFVFSLQASEVPYTYLEAEFNSVDYDDADGDAWELRGSFDINERFYAFAGFGSGNAKGDTTISLAKIESSGFELGAGLHFPIFSSRTDFITELGYAKVDTKNSYSTDIKGSGYGLALGVRSMVSNHFELGAKLQYVKLTSVKPQLVFGNDDNIGIDLYGLYYFPNNFGIGVSYGKNDDTDNIGLKLRYRFD